MRHAPLAAALLLAPVARLAAQAAPAEPMDTDRPSFTGGAGVLVRHRVQGEAGYTLHADGALHEHTVGELLVRFGLGARAELRVATTYDAVRDHGVTTRGMRDGEVGAKLAVLPESHGVLPALALVGGTSLPSGGDRFTDGRATPDGAVALVWALGRGASLAANGTWSRPADALGRHDALGWSALVGQSIGARVGAFAECWTVAEARDAAPTRYADGGLTVRVAEAVQLDVHAGARTSRGEGRTVFAGVGFARRW